MEFDLENPLPFSKDKLPLLFHSENDHMPSKTYLRSLNSQDSTISIRRETMSLIFCFSRSFGPFSSYLAVNYMDRFLSASSMPLSRPWILKLVAISCISLALKMKETEYSVSDLLNECDIIFDSFTIERMELLILGALEWRMRSVNPFSFVNYFISFLNLKDKPSIQLLKDKATVIILKAQGDIKLLEFKPSVVSASALLSATYELFSMQLESFRDAIYSCSYVNKESLLHCYDVMRDVTMECYEPILDMTTSTSYTPPNVLDFHYFSSSISSSHDNQTNGETTDDGSSGGLKAPKY